MLETMIAIGGFELGCRDFASMLSFYEGTLRLKTLKKMPGRADFGNASQKVGFSLYQAQENKCHCPSSLDHFAFKVPSREALGMFLHHLILTQTPILGAIDHGTSEAIYLEDPEGNRIEITCDKAESGMLDEFGFTAIRNDPFDYSGVYYASNALERPFAFPEGTAVGHVSLRVENIEKQKEFYTKLLGLSVSYVKKNHKTHLGNKTNPHQLSLKPSTAEGCQRRDHRVIFAYPDCDSIQVAIVSLKAAGILVEEIESGYLAADFEANEIELKLEI